MNNEATIYMTLNFFDEITAQNFEDTCCNEICFDSVELTDVDYSSDKNIGYITDSLTTDDLNSNNISIFIRDIINRFNGLTKITVVYEPMNFIDEYEIRKFIYDVETDNLSTYILNQNDVAKFAKKLKIKEINDKDEELMNEIYNNLG